MNKITFRNNVWIRQKAPFTAWVTAAASGAYILMQIITIVMNGISSHNAALAFIVFFVFTGSVLYIVKRGRFIETTMVLSLRNSGICLECPLLDGDPSYHTWFLDPDTRDHTAVYDKDIGAIVVRGMMNGKGQASNVYIYAPAPLREISNYLKKGGLTIVTKKRRRRSPSGYVSSKTTKGDYISISGRELTDLLWELVNETERMFLGNTLLVSQEILFEHKGEYFIAGIKYDKKAAKEANETDFCTKYMSVYIENRAYEDPEEFYDYSTIHGVPVKDISDGIYVARDEYERYIRKEIS